MQLCFSTLICPHWTLPHVVGAAAAHGVAGVEFRGLGTEIDLTRHPVFNEELPQTMELLGAHGLAVPCLNTSIALVAPAPDRWEMMLGECHRYAQLGERMGSPMLRIFGGRVPRGMSQREALAMAQRHLRQLAKICAAHGRALVIETHDDWVSGPQLMALVEGYTPQQVGILWNVEPPCRAGHAPADTVRALGGYLRHVHLKDSSLAGGRSEPRLLGEGDLPLPSAIAALRQTGYAGWICLATERRWHPEASPEPEKSLPQFVQYVTEQWSSLS